MGNFCQPNTRIILHTSNIFHYMPTAIYYDYNTRWHLFTYLRKWVIGKKQAVPGLEILLRGGFNDHHRKINEILPWYKKID